MKCQSCENEKECVDIGINAWVCGDCLKPLAKQIADDIDKEILERLIKDGGKEIKGA